MHRPSLLRSHALLAGRGLLHSQLMTDLRWDWTVHLLILVCEFAGVQSSSLV